MAQRYSKDQELIKYAYSNLDGVPEGSEDYEKMISGMAYNCWAPELNDARIIRHEMARMYGSIFLKDFNSTDEFMKYRREYLGKIMGKLGGDNIYMEPFSVDYGFNIEIGDNFYSNFNLTILDCSIVRIGSGVMIGPNTTICCATHDLDPVERVDKCVEYAREITIGNKVWIGSNVTILQGATIGDGVTIGANSVVTAGTVIPPYTVAVGTPCRVVKKLPGYDHQD